MRAVIPWTLCALLVVASSGPAAAQPQFSFDWPAIASRLVAQLAPQPGEKILILAHPGLFEDLVPHLRYAIARAGATDVGVVDVLAEPVPQGWDLEVLRRGNTRAREAYRAMFAGVDGAIMMPGATPAHPAYAALQDLLRRAAAAPCTFTGSRTAARSRCRVSRCPVVLSSTRSTSAPCCRPTTRRWPRVLERFEQALRAGEVHITSPGGTNLRFRVGSRVVNRQDGDASAARAARGQVLIDREIELPAGVARVAPLEETVEGTIAFPPSQWDARPVEGLRLHFERGQVVRVEAASGREAVEREMQAAGDAGRRFREFALGFNPAADGARAHAVDSLLRLWRRRGPAVARRQLRAGRHRRRRLRALELLHRPDGDRERPGVGEGRAARVAAIDLGVTFSSLPLAPSVST